MAVLAAGSDDVLSYQARLVVLLATQATDDRENVHGGVRTWGSKEIDESQMVEWRRVTSERGNK